MITENGVANARSAADGGAGADRLPESERSEPGRSD